MPDYPWCCAYRWWSWHLFLVNTSRRTLAQGGIWSAVFRVWPLGCPPTVPGPAHATRWMETGRLCHVILLPRHHHRSWANRQFPGSTWYLWSKTWQNNRQISWWRHQMEIFSALLALCTGNSPVTGEFPTQRPVTRSFVVFFICALNKRLRKQSWSWRFETPSRSLSRHYNVTNPTMQLSHIPQHTIQNRNVHISVLNGVLWDMGQLHCGICEICLWGSLPTRSPQFQFLKKNGPVWVAML